MNLNKAERLTHMLERLVKIQNQSRSSSQYEMDNTVNEAVKQIKKAMLEEGEVSEDPHPF